MAKGSWQIWIPVWNIYYMIREYIREGIKEEEREKEHIALMAEIDSIRVKIDALRFERANALVLCNQEDRAKEIEREINELMAKHMNKLLGE